MGRVDQMRALPPALIAITTLATTAACGSSASKPAAQSTRAAPNHSTITQRVRTPHEFMSHRYGFRVTLTDDWGEHDALVDWNGNKLQGLASAAFANFTDPATGRTLVAAATRVAKETGLTMWRAAMVRAAPAVCSGSASVEHTTLAGERALAWTATCSDGYDVDKLAALHHRRGYIILLASPNTIDNTRNRRLFDVIRRSFQFTR